MKIKFEERYATGFDKPKYLDCEKDMLTADELAAVINALCAGGAKVTGIVRDKDAY
jgi:hypothetical protein